MQLQNISRNRNPKFIVYDSDRSVICLHSHQGFTANGISSRDCTLETVDSAVHLCEHYYCVI